MMEGTEVQNPMKAYVLINTELGQEAAVVKVLKDVEGITDIFSLYGIYDVIVQVEAESMDKIKEIVFNNIRRLDSVKTTITLITYGDPILRD
jgi:DNA-binding Lrp family transcriptional regulator